MEGRPAGRAGTAIGVKIAFLLIPVTPVPARMTVLTHDGAEPRFFLVSVTGPMGRHHAWRWD
ncbi:MAG: hypothetical protein WAO36_09110 [Candidatus Methanoculleus thermohydrogenotrophicum]|jgi:hypothetical protein|nr:hypothetical protein [Candidatus Methanoculleus thermohydrogenotrophicum]NLM82852.1 hypothetical protein [Candidatus Methanoculleus thermohydrogenotrophicum]HPZ38798.1 hypothetical protein [Candidatus Methanoculleus thermohydrogenotrophicum]HQC91953.1 hypothetical protein [Candidatus Methanoculleus thermohydrogenotrophicum]